MYEYGHKFICILIMSLRYTDSIIMYSPGKLYYGKVYQMVYIQSFK